MIAALLFAALAVSSAGEFQSVLDRMRIDQDVPGVSAVITINDRVFFAGASGMADLETARAMTADTVVYAGSLSKVFTAVLTLGLVEDGTLSLEQLIDGIATETSADAPNITVAHLLTHASGLAREGDFGYWFSGVFPDNNDLANYLRTTELREPPGAALHYSNVGYATLGLLIEDVNGRTYGDSLLDRVLKPLGMMASGAPGPVKDIAAGYTPVGRVIPNEARPFEEWVAPSPIDTFVSIMMRKQ